MSGRTAPASSAAAASTAAASGCTAAGTATGACSAGVTSRPAYCRSIGISMLPGCGRPVRMSSITRINAGAICWRIRTVSTRRHTAASIAAWLSASCTKPRPLPKLGVSAWPVIISTGDDAKPASYSPGSPLAAPGPVLVTATPSRPVARA